MSLGSGTGGGTRRNVTQMNKRLGAIRARIPRFKALRRSGVRTDRLLRTGGNAALNYFRAEGTWGVQLHAVGAKEIGYCHDV